MNVVDESGNIAIPVWIKFLMDNIKNHTKPVSGRDRQRKYRASIRGHTKEKEYESRPYRKYRKLVQKLQRRIQMKIKRIAELEGDILNDQED